MQLIKPLFLFKNFFFYYEWKSYSKKIVKNSIFHNKISFIYKTKYFILHFLFKIIFPYHIRILNEQQPLKGDENHQLKNRKQL